MGGLGPGVTNPGPTPNRATLYRKATLMATTEKAHKIRVIPVTEQGWRNAGYRYVAVCKCGYRKECVALGTAEMAALDHIRNNG
jgi:hypothetical protein